MYQYNLLFQSIYLCQKWDIYVVESVLMLHFQLRLFELLTIVAPEIRNLPRPINNTCLALESLTKKKHIFIILTLVDLDCIIAGWGFINLTQKINPEKLQFLEVKIFDWNMCKRQRPVLFQNFHICAGVPRALNKATCMVYKEFFKGYLVQLQSLGNVI